MTAVAAKKRIKPPRRKKAPAKKKKRQARPLSHIEGAPPDPARKATAAQHAKRLQRKVDRAKEFERYGLTRAELRHMAKAEYVTDPEQRSVEEIHRDPNRPYHRLVPVRTMQYWAATDGWAPRRERYWAEVTEISINGIQQQIAAQRLKELSLLTTAADIAFEYLLPVGYDPETGDFERYPKGHKYEGMPKYALAMPRGDQWARMWLEIDKQRMLKRGEATTRSDALNEAEDGQPKLTRIDPVAQKVSIDRGDIQAMAHALLEARQPELRQFAGEQGHTPEDDEEDEGDGGIEV